MDNQDTLENFFERSQSAFAHSTPVALPPVWRRWVPIWQRNYLVWRRLFWAALLGNFGEPTLYLLGLGFGLGFFVGEVDGLPYLHFLAAGIVCSSAMQTASFEAMYSAFTRMNEQRTWDAMLATPLTLRDVVIGEAMWAASKGLFSAGAILLVAAALGVAGGWIALWVLPVSLLTGLCFAALGLAITALARDYDFFLYYTTLVLTPLGLLSGVFFPFSSLPSAVQAVVQAFPLYHAIVLTRPLMSGQWPDSVVLHILVLLAYTLTGLWLATHLLRRRLLA